MLLQVMWLALTNQSASFQSRVPSHTTMDFVYKINYQSQLPISSFPVNLKLQETT